MLITGSVEKAHFTVCVGGGVLTSVLLQTWCYVIVSLAAASSRDAAGLNGLKCV